MKEITLVFPHQLFKSHPAIANGRTVYLIEEKLFFSQYNFHQQKLVMHRASMKAYAQFLATQNISVKYIEASDALADISKLINHLKLHSIILT